MNSIVKKGKNLTTLNLMLLFLVFIITFFKGNRDAIIYRNWNFINFKLTCFLILFFVIILTLIYFIYKGKKWARIIFIILGVYEIISVLISLSSFYYPLFIKKSLINQIYLLFCYISIISNFYHFGFSKSFKEFSKYKNKKNNIT